MNWTTVEIPEAPHSEYWGKDIRISDAVLGRAAAKILQGEVTPAEVAELPACHWCSVYLSHRRACWHYAARLLFEQGLKPWPRPPAELECGPEQLSLSGRAP
jgi:hypothetical protein